MAIGDQKPHAVVVPFPAQGHVNPLLKVAKLLHSPFFNFHISFVHTEYNYRRLLRSRGGDALAGLPSFRYVTIPDGLPHSDGDATQDLPAMWNSVLTNFLGFFKELLHKLNAEAADGKHPPVTHIIGDFAMPFTAEAGKELNIPVVIFWNASACGLLGFAQFQPLIDRGVVPLKDSYLTDGTLDTVVDWAPESMKGICLKDIPTLFRTTTLDDIVLKYCLVAEKTTCKSGWPVIFNTFEALEQDVLRDLAAIIDGPMYCLGPMQLMINKVGLDEETRALGNSLWKEDDSCLQWLDTQKPKSVIYISFGCVTTMSKEKLDEFAWGIANSKHHFLWIIRPDIVGGDSTGVPPEFVEETKDRGMLASWCNQEKVLSHPATAAFLTHAGWNSTLESIGAGIPMICWPFFAEQQTNCWFSCNKWGVGIEIDNDVKREVVEAQVREMMEGEKGKEMRQKAEEWGRLAHEAVSSNGSSYLDLVKLKNDVLFPKK